MNIALANYSMPLGIRMLQKIQLDSYSSNFDFLAIIFYYHELQKSNDIVYLTRMSRVKITTVDNDLNEAK